MTIELVSFMTYDNRPEMLFCEMFSDGSMIWVSEGDCPQGCWPAGDDWYERTVERIAITNKAIALPEEEQKFAWTDYFDMSDAEQVHHLLHAKEAGQQDAMEGWIAEIGVEIPTSTEFDLED